MLRYPRMEVIIFTREGEKRKAEYREYLQSEHWRTFRRHIYQIMPYCLWCRTTEELNVCHLTYERRGHELDSDVVVMCKTHHYLMDDGLLPMEPILEKQQRLLEKARSNEQWLAEN